MFKIQFLKPLVVLSSLLAVLATHGRAEEFYVDPLKGGDDKSGSMAQPFATVTKAVNVANALTGTGPISIKLAPGIYALSDKVMINPVRTGTPDARFIIEAMVMPDDPQWAPEKMPVIESVSPNNSTNQFPHSTGFLVAANQVGFRGLKFLGNPHPAVTFYYPITKEDKSLRGLEVSQCYFISEKNSVPIQGGIWAHGRDTVIDHCIFYNCRNAILLFENIGGFSITHTLMYGANESAIWMGPVDSEFTFTHNIVTGCHYFWVRPENSTPAYPFSDCLITGNDFYTGFYTRTGLIPTPADSNHRFTETNIVKSATVKLIDKTDEKLPRKYLNPASDSAGYGLDVGIFTTPKGK